MVSLGAIAEADGITPADLAKALEAPTETGSQKLKFYSRIQALVEKGLVRTENISLEVTA